MEECKKCNSIVLTFFTSASSGVSSCLLWDFSNLLVLQCLCSLGSLPRILVRRKGAILVLDRNHLVSTFIRGLDRLLMFIRNIMFDV